MDLGLKDKVFLVTASSSGLGLASAQALAAEGARLCLVARRQQVLDDLVDDFDGVAIALSGNLGDPALPERAVDAAVRAWGRIDGAVVSVGGPPKGSVLGTSDEQWHGAFDHVFLPAVRVARAVVAQNRAARLAFVLSSSVKTPLPDMAPSNGLRPGLAALVKQLADEIGPDGGRAVGLMPGSIATDRMEFLLGQAPDPAAAHATTDAGIPLRRMGRPEEFGRVAAFMVSDAASYVSGSVVAVDGGSMRAL